MNDLEGALRNITLSQRRPLVSLCESWQDEAGIDAAIWTATDPATGTAWTRGASGAYLRVTTVPNANETARLVSDQRWATQFGVYGDNSIYRMTCLEFEMKLADVANLDNTPTMFGFSPGAADTRATNGIIAFTLKSDALTCITDSAGTETETTTLGETLTNWNKLGIYISRLNVRFTLNGKVVATHTTNVPATPMYINHYLDTEAGGAATLELGVVRCWIEDSVRYKQIV